MHLRLELIHDFKLNDVKKTIQHHKKKAIQEIKLLDFVWDEQGNPLDSDHGIYMFFDASGETCLYVGKNSSLQFIERLPSHFAQSEGSWSNHFLKYLMKHKKISSFRDATIAASSCTLLLLPLPYETLLIKKAESIFRFLMNPVFNAVKKEIDVNLRFSELFKPE